MAIWQLDYSVCDIRIYNIDCAVMHPKGAIILLKKGPKTHKIQDGGMFTWKFKMTAIFCKIVLVDTFNLIPGMLLAMVSVSNNKT